MQDPAEPTEPRPRQRHLFRWVLGAMLGLLFASSAALFQWGDMEFMPGFVQIWKLRGELLVKRVKYWDDSEEAQFAQWFLGLKLVENGSYKSTEKQFRSNLASEARVYGTNVAESSETK